jgi:hypothetical protein
MKQAMERAMEMEQGMEKQGGGGKKGFGMTSKHTDLVCWREATTICFLSFWAYRELPMMPRLGLVIR